MRERLHIGEVAALVGVSPKTIRYYHEVGLLAEPERTDVGYRLYTAQDLLRLQRIRCLRALGLSLDRIKEILGKPDREHEPALRHALQMLVEELATGGTTIFLSTHDLATAESICHRVGIIQRGRLLVEGSAAELREIAAASNLEDVFLSLTEREVEVSV